jgi:hypothetical protein
LVGLALAWWRFLGRFEFIKEILNCKDFIRPLLDQLFWTIAHPQVRYEVELNVEGLRPPFGGCGDWSVCDSIAAAL